MTEIPIGTNISYCVITSVEDAIADSKIGEDDVQEDKVAEGGIDVELEGPLSNLVAILDSSMKSLTVKLQYSATVRGDDTCQTHIEIHDKVMFLLKAHQKCLRNYILFS